MNFHRGPVSRAGRFASKRKLGGFHRFMGREGVQPRLNEAKADGLGSPEKVDGGLGFGSVSGEIPNPNRWRALRDR